MALLEPEAVVAGFDDVAAVSEPVEQRRRHLGVAKDVAPFPERQVRGHDQRDTLVELADQVEQQRTAVVRERQVAQFIEHDRVLVEQPVGEAPGTALALSASSWLTRSTTL